MNILNLEAFDQKSLKDDYQKHGVVRIPVALEPSVMNLLQSGMKGPFEKRSILEDNSSEFTLNNPLLKLKINLLFNDPDFLDLMTYLTGTKISLTKQRLYYTDPDCTSLPWHDDSYEQDGRVASLRFELSGEEYEGGEFSFKTPSESMTLPQLKFGEGLLFKIEHGKCYHMVAPVKKGLRFSLIVFLCR